MSFTLVSPHFVANFHHCLAFQSKSFAVTYIVITGCSAETNHWIFLLFFEERTSQQIFVFIALKIAHADDDIVGVKCRSNFCYSLSQFIDKEISLIGITLREFFNFLADFFIGNFVKMNLKPSGEQ